MWQQSYIRRLKLSVAAYFVIAALAVGAATAHAAADEIDTLYRNILQHPANTELNLRFAQLAEQSGHLRWALAAYERVTLNDPDNAEGRQGLQRVRRALQPAITIPANALSVTIGLDGTVSVTQPGVVAPVQVGSMQLANFINPTGLQSQGSNLYVETASSGTASTNVPGTNGAGTLSQGYVETSNVNVVEELVNMIQTQRAYEINSKAITVSDQMLQKLSQM